MKKFILGLGAVAAVAAPIAAVVSCGHKDSNDKTYVNKLTKLADDALKAHPEAASYIFGQNLGETVAAVLNAHHDETEKTNQPIQTWGGDSLAGTPSYLKTHAALIAHFMADENKLTDADVEALKEIFDLSLKGTKGAAAAHAAGPAVTNGNQYTPEIQNQIKAKLAALSNNAAKALYEAFTN